MKEFIENFKTRVNQNKQIFPVNIRSFLSTLNEKKVKPVILWVILGIGVVFPLLFDGFTIYQFTLVGAYAIAILGLNILTGYSGQFSIGHSAFFAIGAYTTAIIGERFAISIYLTIPLAGVVTFICGVLFGFPALRLGFVALALATYSLAIVFPQLLKSSYLEEWTGGVQGIYLDRPGPPEWASLTEDQWWYYVTLIIVIIMFWFARNLVKGRSGRIMKAIRDNPIAAASMGINVSLHKVLVFGISGLYMGIGGSIAALLTDFVAPDTFSLSFAIELLTGSVVGGITSVYGALFGGLFIYFMNHYIDYFYIYGIILILAVWLFPSGVSGLISKKVDRIPSNKENSKELKE